MHKLKIIAVLICFITINLKATTYYVSATGNNANSGLTVALPFKTLNKAATVANAGDVVYVKAGDYGNENVVFLKSGTATSPITFQGYKITPGDEPPLLVNNANPYAPFVSTDMPTFNGGNRLTGDGFKCENQNYLVFKNFQIKNYAVGFRAGWTSQDAGNLVLYNINVMSVGDNITTNNPDLYHGLGILFGSMGTKYSNNNTITNCQVVNAAAEGFGINGNGNKLTGCKVYCNEGLTGYAATDYYIIITGNNNTVTSCYIERTLDLAHGGHGIGAKTNAVQVVDKHLSGINPIPAQNNKFYYCVAKNLDESFYVRHSTAQNNLFYHCKAIGTFSPDVDAPGKGNGITIRDGASDNIFDGCIAENCNAAIEFIDTEEEGATVAQSGNNNKIINGLFYNCYGGVNYNKADNHALISDAGNNLIANCTFYKMRYFYVAQRPCKKMKYIGNIYYGGYPSNIDTYFKGDTYVNDIIPGVKHSAAGTTGTDTDTYFAQCNFINIPSMPTGYVGVNGNIAADPLFESAVNNNFHLNSNSPCINKVDPITLPNNPKDFDEKARYNGGNSDIGAFEFYTCVSGVNIQDLYGLPLTKSASWIKSVATTTIPGLMNVVLDADPGSYVLIQPTVGNTFTAEPTGTGTFTARSANGCAAIARMEEPTTTTAITKVENTAIKVYPNPSTGLFTIESELDDSYRIEVTNMMGQLVYKGAYTSKLDLTSLKSSIYFLQILSKEGKYVLSNKISKD